MPHPLARLELMVGSHALVRLAAKHVAVFGIGGVGGHAAEALCRSGVGSITIVDYDTVAETNINRQLAALHSTIGRSKVNVLAERCKDINPQCQINPLQECYSEDNSSQLLSDEYDFVIDAIDMVSAKTHLIERCLEKNIPIISSMGAGNKWDPTQLRIADISETHTCPLAKVVRQRLRKDGWHAGLTVVFSLERPARLSALERLNDSCTRAADAPMGQACVPGSTPFVPPAAGLVAASYVVGELLG